MFWVWKSIQSSGRGSMQKFRSSLKSQDQSLRSCFINYIKVYCRFPMAGMYLKTFKYFIFNKILKDIHLSACLWFKTALRWIFIIIVKYVIGSGLTLRPSGVNLLTLVELLRICVPVESELLAIYNESYTCWESVFQSSSLSWIPPLRPYRW